MYESAIGSMLAPTCSTEMHTQFTGTTDGAKRCYYSDVRIWSDWQLKDRSRPEKNFERRIQRNAVKCEELFAASAFQFGPVSELRLESQFSKMELYIFYHFTRRVSWYERDSHYVPQLYTVEFEGGMATSS
jgi:hypothetical protein